MASGIHTYAIMSHGLLVPHESRGIEEVIIPKNCLVVMNCASALQRCTSAQQSKLYAMYSDSLFDVVKGTPQDSNIISHFIDILLTGLNEAGYNEMCLFHSTCPNLELTPELDRWRDGIFSLPIVRPLDVHLACKKHATTGVCSIEYRKYLAPERQMDYLRNVHEEFGAHGSQHLSDLVSLLSKSPNHLYLIIVHACTVPPHDYKHLQYGTYESIPFNTKHKDRVVQRVLESMRAIHDMEIVVGGKGAMKVRPKRTNKRIWAYGRWCMVYRMRRKEYVKHKGIFVSIHDARRA
jgi:hypothetical protein